jgi:hypothetical protein
MNLWQETIPGLGHEDDGVPGGTGLSPGNGAGIKKIHRDSHLATAK